MTHPTNRRHDATTCPAAGVTQALQPVIDCLQRALPGIPVQLGDAQPGQITVCDAAQIPVHELVEQLRRAHPEAGPHYWSARAYSLLVWQPAYAAVLSVHLAGVLPQLQQVGQCCSNGFVWGMSMPAVVPQAGHRDVLIQQAGQTVLHVSQTLASSLAHDIAIHHKFAARLLADCIMAALLLVRRQRPDLCNAEVRDWSRQWLDASRLSGCSGVIPVRLDDGREHLILERRVCCQHFRRHDGELCSTCPKLKPDDRLIMIKQELASNADHA